MKVSFYHRDVIAIENFNKEDILRILRLTNDLKETPQPQLLQGKILGSCFYEPSTRTRLSFESAMQKLGGNVIGFSDPQNTSSRKGENLHDSMKMMEHYADVIVLRHPLEGAAQWAAETLSIPVINAGDGTNQHPTQTFLDLFTIQECQERLDSLNIALVGDLKYGRTVHSLAQALTHFKARLFMVSPSSLEMPKEICHLLRNRGIKFSFHKSIEEIIHKLDIMYITRIQEERFAHKLDYEKVSSLFCIQPKTFEKAQDNLKVLHPLPRVNEIDREVDQMPFAYYFQQAENGLYTRQALLAMVLGKLE